MNRRLEEVIRYKTGGRHKEFADLMGWTAPYLGKLLRGDNFGITPVMRLVERLPELNVRWLLTGQGVMLDSVEVLRSQILGRALTLLRVEKSLGVMTADELRSLERAVEDGSAIVASPETLADWERRLAERDWSLRLRAAQRQGSLKS